MASKSGIKQASQYNYYYSRNYPTLEITLCNGRLIRQHFISLHLGRNHLLLHKWHLVTHCIFLFAKRGFTEQHRCQASRSAAFKANCIPFLERTCRDLIEACELEAGEWFREADLPLTFVGLGQECKWRSTYHMFKYLNGIDQANRLLNKIFSILFPRQIYLHNDLEGQV